VRQSKGEGFEPLDGSAEEFAQLIARGMVTWAAAAEAAALREQEAPAAPLLPQCAIALVSPEGAL
jgi:hypothetical protein